MSGVMAGLDPAIQLIEARSSAKLDRPVKPGDDSGGYLALRE
jgi:hypothetical protein